MKNYNICFVTEDFYPSFIGGQGVWGKELVLQLAKLGHHITVLADKRPDRVTYWQKVKNVKLITVPFSGSVQILVAFFEYIYFFLYCRNKYFDILHANQLSGIFFILQKPKNIGQIVVTMHNTFDQLSKASLSIWKKIFYRPFIALESLTYRRADAVICHTEFQKEYAIETYGIPHTRVFAVPMGVAQQKKFHSSSFSSQPTVLYVGRLVTRKRVDLFIKAISMLPDCNGVIVGDGPERPNLDKIAPINVRFEGRVKDTTPYFQQASVFILLSQAEGGVSLASYEAASFGLPLILSADAADNTILQHKKNGYIIYSNSANEVKTAIQNCLLHNKEYGKQSLIRAKKLTWKYSVVKTIDVYLKVLSKESE